MVVDWSRGRGRKALAAFLVPIISVKEGSIMSEERKMSEDPKMSEEPEGQRQESTILDEFDRLGRELSAAVKALWESEESRKLRQDLRDGFVELGEQLDTAVKSAQESEAAKEFGDQVKETFDKARESDVAGKMEQGLVSGLRDLNQELSKLVASLQEKQPPESSEEAGTEG
jgi:hypothetical protein